MMQKQNLKRHLALASAVVGICGSELRAAVTLFTNETSWETAAADFTTIGFTELPIGTWVTDQYASLGVHFTDGGDQVIGTSFVTFPQDGIGLSGFSKITVEFEQPMYWLAAHYPGSLQIQLFSDGELLYTSVLFGKTGFLGVVSDMSFDMATLSDADGFVFIDDLHFGPPIPAPGAVVVIALALVMSGRRRRR